MQNRCCAIGYFLNNSSKAHVINFNDSERFYFTAGIYYLHGKLTAVWNFTSVNLTVAKFVPKWVSLHSKHVNAENEVTLHRSQI